NSINENVNQALFIPNYTGARNTEFDGFTVPLDCVAVVTPGVPNRVKIAIADTSDGIYDAAVFIAAGGMRSPGTGAVTGSNVVRVIEYYHAVFDHYFMTAIADEITKLDNGTFAGWARTGERFHVYTNTLAGSADVCRFFSTAFNPKSSHFYTSDPNECSVVKVNHDWQLESGRVFGVLAPGPQGDCPSGSDPVYRMYNNGQGAAPNHRYTTSLATRTTMLGRGWIPEGYGPLGVIFCAPT